MSEDAHQSVVDSLNSDIKDKNRIINSLEYDVEFQDSLNNEYALYIQKIKDNLSTIQQNELILNKAKSAEFILADSLDVIKAIEEMIQKINVVKEDFKFEPLDVRFSISREIPTHGSYDMDRKRSKYRHSFVRKNLSIDMTVSSGDNADMDSEDASSYQIELEIVKPSDVNSYNELFNILYKISDISKLI